MTPFEQAWRLSKCMARYSKRLQEPVDLKMVHIAKAIILLYTKNTYDPWKYVVSLYTTVCEQQAKIEKAFGRTEPYQRANKSYLTTKIDGTFVGREEIFLPSSHREAEGYVFAAS